jgi:hypothetical protein
MSKSVPCKNARMNMIIITLVLTQYLLEPPAIVRTMSPRIH